MVIICGIIVAVGCFITSKFFISPTYCSTAKIYVITKTTNQFVTYNDITLSTYLSKDYMHLIKNRDVLEMVIANCKLKDTYNSLSKRIKIENLDNTRILSVSVNDKDPSQAQLIATEICMTAAEHIKSVMNLESVNVAEQANLPIIQSNPNVKNWTLMGMLVGIFLCTGVIILKVLLDDTIKTSADIERYLGLSTLALIPIINGNSKGED